MCAGHGTELAGCKSQNQVKEKPKATLLKNKRVNIRISSRDLEGLQARAAEEGVLYLTGTSVGRKFGVYARNVLCLTPGDLSRALGFPRAEEMG